ncbi:aldo/keto reductase family oxidoreductase [Paenibacillus yanchengensis]|uniref:Aldo/keto reductase family oxidoreductase n=1 Tax=Paenibacillus yanchengensis TaxID=2035833 RepID=A0ABW4YHU0_9BACL
MKYINIGGSGIHGSAVTLGCMRIAQMEHNDVARLIETAFEAGINMFDHADIYGRGQSEQVFAEALKLTSIKREQMILQSKCGIRQGFFDFSKEHILQSVDQILHRLQTDYLDILLLHRPDALMEPEEVAEAFQQLQSSGKVRQFGVSNHHPGQIELLNKSLSVKLVANQLQFSVTNASMIDVGLNVNMENAEAINRDGQVLDYCRLQNMTIQAWSPLQYGFFEGIFIGHEKYAALNEVLERIAAEQQVTVEAVAVAWILRHPAQMQVVIGTTQQKRVQGMAQASNVQLSREQWYEIYRASGKKLP